MSIFNLPTYVKYEYIILSIFVSFLLFFRNVLFIYFLPLEELGQVAVAQSIVMLITFSQFGFVNGAYIVFATRENSTNRTLLNSAFTLSAIVLLVGLAGVCLFLFTASGSSIWTSTLTFAVASGIFTLLSTFLNNVLIANDSLRQSNVVNILSGIVSLFIFLISPGGHFIGALLSLILQPLSVCVFVLWLNRDLRPTQLSLDFSATLALMRIGFSPYISAVAALAITQTERWSIFVALGSEGLGRFYPVLVVASIFGLVPASLLNYYFPNAKRNFEQGATCKFLQACSSHKRDIYIYFGAWILLSIVVIAFRFYLPGIVGRYDVNIILLALPSFFVYTMRDIPTLYLFSVGRMREILYASCFSFVIFTFAVCVLLFRHTFSLEILLVVKFIALLPATLWLISLQHRAKTSMSSDT